MDRARPLSLSSLAALVLVGAPAPAEGQTVGELGGAPGSFDR